MSKTTPNAKSNVTKTNSKTAPKTTSNSNALVRHLSSLCTLQSFTVEEDNVNSEDGEEGKKCLKKRCSTRVYYTVGTSAVILRDSLK